jgi:hypothetical protein
VHQRTRRVDQRLVVDVRHDAERRRSAQGETVTAPARAGLSAALEGCSIVIAVDRRSSELAAALERHSPALAPRSRSARVTSPMTMTAGLRTPAAAARCATVAAMTTVVLMGVAALPRLAAAALAAGADGDRPVAIVESGHTP